MDWSERLNNMVWGYKNAAVVLNALRVGVFEALGEDWHTADEVAAACRLDRRATEVVLLALAACDVVRLDGDRFSTEPGARPVLLEMGDTSQYFIYGHNLSMMRNWAHLEDVLRTGQPVPKKERSEQELRDFILGMENVSRLSSREASEKLDLAGARRLLDLGGGPGTAALTFAADNPDLACVVFDLPGPVDIAREQIAAAGLGDRVTTVAGDFLTDDYGTGFDVVYIANIIHMLGPDDTRRIFEKSRAALADGGRLMVKDFYLEPSRIAPAAGASFSVNMLVHTPAGKTYTREETLELLTAAGFGTVTSVEIGVMSSILVATAV